MAALVLLVSFFQTGTQAEFTRLMSLGLFLILCIPGLLNAIWIVVRGRIYIKSENNAL